MMIKLDEFDPKLIIVHGPFCLPIYLRSLRSLRSFGSLCFPSVGFAAETEIEVVASIMSIISM